MAESAARSAVVAWAASRGVDVRDINASSGTLRPDGADVRITADLRERPDADWRSVDFVVPVRQNGSNGWFVPSTAVIARLVAATRIAESAPTPRASATSTATATAVPPTEVPSPTPFVTPSPPAGEVIYEADWASGGMDGWIGTPDWQAGGGALINDGSRTSLDPWLEAPVRVEPWQSMIVEFHAEILSEPYGSFGLIARGGTGGWLHLGMRWDESGPDGGAAYVSLGATIRHDTQREREEWFTAPRPLEPGPHLYRFEFVDGEISMFIDDGEVGEIQDGTFAAGEFLGLWSERTPLNISFFRVTLV